MTPEIYALLALIAFVGLVIYLYGHNTQVKTTLDKEFQAIRDKLGMIHNATLAPVSVVNAPPASPVATPAPVPTLPPPLIFGFDGKQYPDVATAKAAWATAGHPAADYMGRVLDVDGNPYTGFSPAPVLAAQVTWNADGSYTKIA